MDRPTNVLSPQDFFLCMVVEEMAGGQKDRQILRWQKLEDVSEDLSR